MQTKSKPALRALRRTINKAAANGDSGCHVADEDPEILADLEEWCLERDYLVRTRPGSEGIFEIRWRY